MAIQKVIVFNGVKYRLMGTGRYYLSQSTTNKGRIGAKGLHTAIWEFYSGQKVPKGFCVHHKDGDVFNNDFKNLECISRAEHFEKHREELIKRCQSPEHLEHLEKIRELASEWHKSPEGRAKASEVFKRIAESKRETHVCPVCGRTFTRCAIRPWGKYGKMCHKCYDAKSHREKRAQKRLQLKNDAGVLLR